MRCRVSFVHDLNLYLRDPHVMLSLLICVHSLYLLSISRYLVLTLCFSLSLLVFGFLSFNPTFSLFRSESGFPD